MPKDIKDGIRSGNVKPGLVVDSVITSNYFEFVLCSHFGALGCSRPTKYTVLKDETAFTGKEIVSTTYHCTYLFPRSTLAVSVVTPVLFAHLCAKRARQYMSAITGPHKGFGEGDLTEEDVRNLNRQIRVSEVLSESLYFL